MSWRGKRKEGYQRASDADSEAHKKSKPDSADDSDDIVVCEISKNRRVTVRNWRGNVMVDVREFYDKDGNQMPGKKGISLTMEQWKVLRDHVEQIDKALNENA